MKYIFKFLDRLIAVLFFGILFILHFNFIIYEMIFGFLWDFKFHNGIYLEYLEKFKDEYIEIFKFKTGMSSTFLITKEELDNIKRQEMEKICDSTISRNK